MLGYIPLEGRPPPVGSNSLLSSVDGTVSCQAVAVCFLQNVGSQASGCIEEVPDLFTGIGPNPEPPVDISGKAGLLLLHGQPDVAFEVVWPSSRGLKFDESPDFRVLVLVVGHACGG